MNLRFEELAMNAWPALQTMLYDGWVIRFSEGYTRRANCINPIYPSVINIDIETKMNYCESLYFNKGLPAIYKLTEATYPNNLDTLLAERGYNKEYETGLWLLNLDPFSSNINNKDIEIKESFSMEWIDGFIACSEPETALSKGIMTQTLSQVTGAKICARLMLGDETAACGFGVIENHFIGLFDIIVHEKYRGQGFGKAIMLAILQEAKKSGAQTAYLQVMTGNTVAETLYTRLGFKELYRYWYRIKRADISSKR